jgi:type I restriction enzyme S subunit
VSVSEWREVTLGDVCDSVSNTHPFEKAKLIFLNTSDVYDGSILHNNYSPVAEMPGQAKKSIKKGDILYSEIRPKNKRYAMVNFDASDYVVSTKFMVIRSNGLIVNKFLYLYLTSNEVLETLQQVAEARSGTFPQITFSQVAELKLNLPPIPEQKAIVATLSALDDMIELNNQINKTLEEMAQAIFKSWFVDFEPFKDGEFEDSELGLIPKGWRVGKLSDVGEIIGGGTPSKSKPEYYSEIGIPWITPKDLSINKNKYISRGEIDISELGLRESSARLMPKGTVLFSSRAPIGYIAIAKNAVTTNQGFKSVVPFENISSEYIYLLLKNSINEIESRATGSTFKEISGGEMKKVPIILPPKEIIRKFNEIATTLGKTQASLEDENNILMSIRDTLLPKLMSGEIRVPVEEVV